MKMEIPAFEWKDVQRFSVTFARYLLLTGKHQCNDKVKEALLIEGIKKPDLKFMQKIVSRKRSPWKISLIVSSDSIQRWKRT